MQKTFAGHIIETITKTVQKPAQSNLAYTPNSSLMAKFWNPGCEDDYPRKPRKFLN